MAETWNARSAEHQRFFRREVLAPLIAATRPLDLRTPDAIDDAVRAWILSLKDVPQAVLVAGVEALLLEASPWMPKPGDLRRVCASAITARRKAISARANAITAECDDCQGSTLVPIVDGAGITRMTRCGCHKRAMALYEGLPEPLALPPAEREDGAA